ncbi:spondin domain-containing protein, partial [Kaarinaea lacus]
MKDLIRLPLILLMVSGVLSACSDDSDDNGMDEPQMIDFQVTVHNLSANQPLTPLAVVLHQPDYTPWALGSQASDELEQLAEGGDTSAFINSASADAMVYATAAGSAVFLPGNSSTINISAMPSNDITLSIASMLANTNDAFTGVTGLDVSGMNAGQSISVMLKVMDAGTEANTEAAGTIPGPADGG